MGSGRAGETRRVAILSPMPPELRPLVRLLSLRKARAGDGFLTGRLGPIEVVATTTGIGTRAAGRAAERLLDAAPVAHLLVVGIAGGIGPSVEIGDLVVPERVLDLASGAVLRPEPLGVSAARGTLATSDALLADPRAAARLEQQGVIAIDMETAAIAAVCERRGCPWSVLRAVSDRADDGTTDPAILGLVDPDGRADLAALTRFVLTRPRRIPQLFRLARGMQRAASTAARAAVEALTTL